VTDAGSEDGDYYYCDIDASWGMAAYTEYEVEVRAVAKGLQIPGLSTVNEESLPASLTIMTPPMPPYWLEEEELDIHSVLLKWDPPAEVPVEDILHYEVKYSDVPMTNTFTTIALGPEVRLMNLAQDTSYNVHVKLVAKRTQSEWSSTKNFVTEYRQNSMDQLRDDLYGAMSSVSDALHMQTSFCSSNPSTNSAGTLTYTSATTSVNNVEGAAMDTNTGVFTAGARGVYQISLSLKMISGGSQTHNVWIVRNGAKLENTKMSTTFGSNSGQWEDNAARDIMLNLKKGDQVSVTHETGGSKGLENILFCVTSVSFETSA